MDATQAGVPGRAAIEDTLSDWFGSLSPQIYHASTPEDRSRLRDTLFALLPTLRQPEPMLNVADLSSIKLGAYYEDIERALRRVYHVQTGRLVTDEFVAAVMHDLFGASTTQRAGVTPGAMPVCEFCGATDLQVPWPICKGKRECEPESPPAHTGEE